MSLLALAVPAPVVVLGAFAATSPALYLALATTGDAPPLPQVARRIGIAITAFAIALAGLVLPTLFVALTSASPRAGAAAMSAALGAALILAFVRLGRELAPTSSGGRWSFGVWTIATFGIAGRLWIDLAREVIS